MIPTDINGKKRIWLNHKENDKKGIKGISKHNSKLVLDFINDYELGVNVGMFKGRRTPATLTKLRHQLIFFCKQLKKDLDKIDKKDLHKLFLDMEEGVIKKKSGHDYIGVGEFVKGAKSFYGWLIRTEKVIKNPTSDLSISSSNGNGRKPNWVYLGNEKMKRLIDHARGDYRALILFLYDSGVRPQEAWRIRISDFNEEFSVLDIPEVRENKERVSKTFARKIKLIKCSKLLKEYVRKYELKGDDLLIHIIQPTFNQYLRRTAKLLFGIEPTEARGTPDRFKSYDIRHNSVCYYLDKYKRNKDLMYRFGWKKEDKIFYYSEFLGINDTIEEDMITEEDKSKMQREIDKLKLKNNIIKDKFEEHTKLIKKILKTLMTPQTKRELKIPSTKPQQNLND